MSDEKVDAWMPLWIGAYLADTMSLSRDSHGGYLLLLFAYWRNRGPLVDDDEEMAGITKATPEEWEKLRPRLARFFTIEGGVWRHSRADKELAKAGEHKEAAVKKAKAGAAARWGVSSKHAPSNAASNAQAVPGDAAPADPATADTGKPTGEPEETGANDAPSNAQALPKQCPTPSPINPSLPTVEKGAPRKRSAAPPPPPAWPCPDDVDGQVWADWLALRKAKKAPVTATVVSTATGEAVKAGMSFEAFLRIWCARGTQGFFADWIRPNERQTFAAGQPEPAWRTEQRERSEAFAGPAAARRPGTTPQPTEVIDATAPLALG